MPWLINANQLDKFRKNQKNIIILDASWHLPAENRNAEEEFQQAHIAGARFLDLNLFHDPHTSTPNMLLQDQSLLAERISALGITNEQKIFFYDQSKLHSSCRALWMFKVLGHNPLQLYLLDGGYAAWQSYAGKIEAGPTRSGSKKMYRVNWQSQYLCSLAAMKENVQQPRFQVIDVRHPSRFAGGKESRPHLRAGHIPDSFCFPYFTMFDASGKLKPLDKIRKQLTGIGVNFNYPIVTTCGSAITAPILDFVLDLLNHQPHAVYDGSWSEWALDTLYPGESSIADRPVRTSLDDYE